MTTPSNFYDQNQTRYRLAKSIPGEPMLDWLFIPGGPGVDSDCFARLIEQLSCPGNYWLIDFPENGTNTTNNSNTSDICSQWPMFLVDTVKQFKLPMLIGHSFGGYLPLFAPELENLLRGLVIINSLPKFEIHAKLFSEVQRKYNLPPLDIPQQTFIMDPTLENIRALYKAEAEYLFSNDACEQGIEEIILKLHFCLGTEHWWYSGGKNHYSQPCWVPKNVPTVIIEGSEDKITPPGMYQLDPDFNRDNIEILCIQGAGHFPWLEQCEVLAGIINRL